MNHPARPLTPALTPSTACATMERVAENLARAVLGKKPQLRLAVTCLVARRPPAARGRPGRGQDHAGRGPRPLLRALLRARPVHRGPDARGHPRRAGVPRPERDLRVPARPPLPPAGAGRRAQPRPAAHPVGAARGDGAGPGQPRRRHPPAAAALHRGRHPEPGGLLRHLSPARLAAGPLPDAAVAGPPGARGGGRSCSPRAGSATRCSALQRGGHARGAARAADAGGRRSRWTDAVADYAVRLAQATRAARRRSSAAPPPARCSR